MARPPVLAVLVAHASGSWLADALASVEAQTYPALELVVVAVGDLPVPPGAVRVVAVDPKAGFARAVNDGVAAAGGGEQPYLLLLHDDVALAPDAVARLVERAEAEPDAAAVGAKLVEWDEPEILQAVGGSLDRFATRRSGLEAREVDHGQHDEVSDVVFASAACLLVRRQAFEEHGRLDPDAWPLYEDADLCWRLRASGARVVVAPAARARHAAALARGLRRAAGPSFGAVGIRTHAERGRLRFILKNYQPLTVLLILPQYAALALVSMVASLGRREFWRLRCWLEAWLRVGAELPRIAERRRRAGVRRVDDEEILTLASKGAASARRYARVAIVGRAADALARAERRAAAVLRDPVTWASAAAAVVVVLTLRRALWSGPFTLGDLRPLPALGRALEAYAARLRAEGLDGAAPGGPGLVLLGALRSFPGVSAALALKILLVGPLCVAALGAVRMGRALGLGEKGRRFLAITAAANPATLVLMREGDAGALVTWAATPWLAAALLSPRKEASVPESLRTRSRWVLAWAVVAALHPPGAVWLALLGAAIAAASAGDGRTAARVRLLGLGVAGAFVLNLPWSLEWLTTRSPLVGAEAGLLRVGSGVSFGAGWPLLVWAAAAAVGPAALGPSRFEAWTGALLGVAWLAGAALLVPAPAALVAAGWCVLLLFAAAGRALRDELPRYSLGWRQAAVVAVGATVGAAWMGGAVSAVADGADTLPRAVVPSAREPTGRVLWALPTERGTRLWATAGFTRTLLDWPRSPGPEERIATRSLEAARDGSLHRLGSVLSLAGVSHVVALAPGAREGLHRQVDLSEAETQGPATVYRNAAWRGFAQLLPSPPGEPLSSGGVEALAGPATAVVASGLTLNVPSEGVLYLASGARDGWKVGGRVARPAGVGVWVQAPGPGELRVLAPGAWRRGFLPVQGVLALALAFAWVAGVYLAGPQLGTAASASVAPSSPIRRRAVLIPAVLVAAAFGLVWSGFGRDAPGFVSEAWYCPPVGEGTPQRLAVVNPSREPVAFFVRPQIAQPASFRGTLGPRDRATVDADPRTGAVVEAFGRGIAVASVVGSEPQDTALCARGALRRSFFPEGGRAATGDSGSLRTAFVLHNPFPEPARARVRLFTEEQTLSPPVLQDVRVDPGTSTTIDPETQLPPQASLGAEITLWQGRAVSARRMRRAGALSWSLGTDATSSGVLARASTKDAGTRLVAVNPSARPARVSMSIAGSEGSLPSLRFDLEAAGRDAFDIGSAAAGHASLLVRVRAVPPVAVESVVVPQGRSGISIFPPLRPALDWVIPAAEGRRLLVTNPGAGRIEVRLVRLGVGPPIQAFRLKPGGTREIQLSGDAPFGLLASSSGGPVVAAVVGGSGGSAGVPIDVARRRAAAL